MFFSFRSLVYKNEITLVVRPETNNILDFKTFVLFPGKCIHPTWVKDLETSCRFPSHNGLYVQPRQRFLFKWNEIQSKAFTLALFNKNENSWLQEEKNMQGIANVLLLLNGRRGYTYIYNLIHPRGQNNSLPHQGMIQMRRSFHLQEVSPHWSTCHRFQLP